MSAGKGDRPRPVDKKKFDESYDRIFKKSSKRFKQASKKEKTT